MKNNLLQLQRAAMARPTGIKTKSIPLRLSDQDRARVREAAEKLGIGNDQQVMRMAMNIGLEALRRVNWSLETLICDAAGMFGNQASSSAPGSTQSAEEETKRKVG